MQLSLQCGTSIDGEPCGSCRVSADGPRRLVVLVVVVVVMSLVVVMGLVVGLVVGLVGKL